MNTAVNTIRVRYLGSIKMSKGSFKLPYQFVEFIYVDHWVLDRSLIAYLRNIGLPS